MDSNFLNNLFGLENKVVAVTGSNGQLGNAFCNYFKEAGAIVIGLDIQESPNRKNTEAYYSLDVSDLSMVEAVFTKIFKNHNGLDVLINNAGVSTFEPFEERPEEKFDWVMDVNLKGTFNCIQQFVKQFDNNQDKEASIVNIASMYGMISPDFRIYEKGDRKNSEVYGATKAGIIQMTKYFAVHLADRNIRVNAVSPGGVFNPDNPQAANFRENYSQRCPMKRMANDDEIAGAVLYLSSTAASYVTGQNLAVDGGMTSW